MHGDRLRTVLHQVEAQPGQESALSLHQASEAGGHRYAHRHQQGLRPHIARRQSCHEPGFSEPAPGGRHVQQHQAALVAGQKIAAMEVSQCAAQG